MQELPSVCREAMLLRAMRRAISKCDCNQPVPPGHVCIPASVQAAQRLPRRVAGGRGIWTLAPRSALAPSAALLERMTDRPWGPRCPLTCRRRTTWSMRPRVAGLHLKSGPSPAACSALGATADRGETRHWRLARGPNRRLRPRPLVHLIERRAALSGAGSITLRQQPPR